MCLFLFVCCAGENCSTHFWFCVALECSMNSSIVKSVGSNVLLCKPARMRVASLATAGILSALAPLLIWVFSPVGALTGILAARVRPQSLLRISVSVRNLRLLLLTLSSLCGFGAGVVVALALSCGGLSYSFSFDVEEATLRVRRVRLNQSE